MSAPTRNLSPRALNLTQRAIKARNDLFAIPSSSTSTTHEESRALNEKHKAAMSEYLEASARLLACLESEHREQLAQS